MDFRTPVTSAYNWTAPPPPTELRIAETVLMNILMYVVKVKGWA